MGLAHCPLCMGLAALCAVRCGAHVLLLWRLLFHPSGPVAASAPGRWGQAPC